MADAEVGDDGYGEDPTVRRLEERFASLLGKPEALFLPSGTMANQIALALLSRPGLNVVVGWRAHVVNHEEGSDHGPARAHQFVTVDDTNGTLPLDDIRWAIEAAQHHHVEVSAISVENTHMVSGGTPMRLDLLLTIAALACRCTWTERGCSTPASRRALRRPSMRATATAVMVSLPQSKG